MKKHLPNLITCLNLSTGAVGVVWVLQTHWQQAIWFVLAAAVFDFFDGFAARMLQVQSAIGKELDSLADMVSFGVLPGVFLYQMMAAQSAGYLAYVALLVVPFSGLRLAKFNIDTRQSDRFIGLPTPANAIMLTSLIWWPLGDPVLWVLAFISVVASLLLVAEIPMIALKFKHFGWKGNESRWLLISLAVVLVAALGTGGVAFLIPTYILLSIGAHLMEGKQKTPLS